MRKSVCITLLILVTVAGSALADVAPSFGPAQPSSGIDWHKFRVELVKDILMVIVVISLGYLVWKIQFFKIKKYELALRVLKTVFQIRYGIKTVRSPFRFIGAIDKKEHKKDSAEAVKAMWDSNRKLWHECLYEHISDLEMMSIEVKEVLGLEDKEKVDSILECASRLNADTKIYFEYERRAAEGNGKIPAPQMEGMSESEVEGVNNQKKKVKEKLLEVEKTVLDFREGEKDNSFSDEIKKAVEEIESNFRKYLKLKLFFLKLKR